MCKVRKNFGTVSVIGLLGLLLITYNWLLSAQFVPPNDIRVLSDITC